MLSRFLHSRWFVVVVALVAVGVPVIWRVAGGAGPADDAVVARVRRGDFRVTVKSSGELRAPKFVNITGPQQMVQAEAYNVKIQSIVPEGTIVKEGDVVAELDRSMLATKMADVSLTLQKAMAQNEQASLDSTLNLSKAREDMRTKALVLEEKRLNKDQSKFEAPSVQRQAEIDLEKAERALKQDSLDIKTKTEQAKAKMREVGSDLERQKNKLKIIQEVMGQFTIHAPAPGMVIYLKDWNGKKRAVGSMVSPWEPTVATLPDLSTMESVTFINEIDVRKIAVGQKVEITLDADPSKKLTGVVTAVANVGEQRPNSDAKVFEVKLNVEKPDTTLRPGMTTGNAIETMARKNVLSIPLEALMTDSGVSYVFRHTGTRVVKQEVEPGPMNDDEVVVRRGLREDDRVLLSPPPDRDKLPLERLQGASTVPKVEASDTAAGAKKIPVKKAAPPAAPPPAKGAPASAPARPPARKG